MNPQRDRSALFDYEICEAFGRFSRNKFRNLIEGFRERFGNYDFSDNPNGSSID